MFADLGTVNCLIAWHRHVNHVSTPLDGEFCFLTGANGDSDRQNEMPRTYVDACSPRAKESYVGTVI